MSPSPESRNSDNTRVRMIIPIWGAAYVERWLSLSFASLRSEGNIYYLHEHCAFELAIMTKAADAEHMRTDPRFGEMTRKLRCKFIPIDEFFPRYGKIPYGVPLTLAYAKGIMDLGQEGLGTYVILMNADFVVSMGSLKSILDRIKQGYAIVTAPSIRVVDETARPIVESRVDAEAGVLAISGRDMMKIVHGHLHNTVKGRIVNTPSVVDSSYYHQIYWRVSDDCLAARCFLVMPLCFRVDRQMTKVICPVDYGFITEHCPDGRFCILGDSDDIAMLELQERHSEAHLLRLAPRSRSPEERLSLLVREIASQAGGWTTAEHRRSATWTLFFHASDLPADIDERVAPLGQFVDRILAAMPPVVSHIRHFHWVPDVRNYRFRMIRGGARGSVALLDDQRNSVTPTLAELLTSSPWAGGFYRRLARYAAEQVMIRSARLSYLASGVYWRLYHLVPQRTAERLAERKRQLAAALAARLGGAPDASLVVYLGEIDTYAPEPPSEAKVFRLRSFRTDRDKMNLKHCLKDDSVGRSGPIIVYAGLNVLSDWTDVSEDLDRLLAQRREVFLVPIVPGLHAQRMLDYAWVLSIMVDVFSLDRFDVDVGVVTAVDKRTFLDKLTTLLRPSFWLGLPHLLTRAVRVVFQTAIAYRVTDADSGPARFSALIVRVASRSEPRAWRALAG